MIGYVKNTKIGAILYNMIHTYSLSVLLILVSLLLSNLTLLSIGFIWTAHIGMDRAVGFGLKYPADFKDTHLQRLK